MENNLAKKIFGQEKQLTRDQLDAALSEGHKTAHKVAQSVMQSDFESDAFDGFHDHAYSTSILESLDAKMQGHLGTYKNPSSNTTYIIGIWFLAFAGIVASSLFLNEGKQYQTKSGISNQVQVEDKAITATAESLEDTQEIQLSDERFIATISIPKQSSLNQASTSTNEKTLTPREEIPQKMAPMSAIQLNQRNKNLSIKKSMIKEVMLSDFIFVDYRGIRSDADFRETPVSGLRANLRSDEASDALDESIHSTTQLSYHQFLKETAAAMKTQNWQFASERFELILQKYPDDLNALFYLAFIKHGQQAFEESLAYLERCEKSIYGNFDQETSWYKLKNYFEMKNYDLAQKQAQKIIEADGFYKAQAEELLRGLRK